MAIGQVEPARPGKIDPPNEDTVANCCNSDVHLAAAYHRDSVAVANQGPFNDHAIAVAGVMVSTASAASAPHSPPTGVATAASLSSSAIDITSLSDLQDAAISAQQIATIPNMRQSI